MSRNSSAGNLPRVPPEESGIQVNCCINPACDNFLKPPVIPDPDKVRRNASDNYRISGSKEGKVLTCKLCGSSSVLKSNLATYREYRRISRDIERAGRVFCPRKSCKNHQCAFQTHPGRYHRRGQSLQGKTRISCKICKKSITISDHRRSQSRTQSYKDLSVFRLLINQSHIKAIARVNELSPQGVYHAIDRVYQQCRRFAAHRERQLAKALNDRKLNIAIDQQLYTVNWSSREDRRLTVLPAVTSVDHRSRYCFAMNLSFDSSLKQEDLEKLAHECGDPDKPSWAREYAQHWLQVDYDVARLKALERKVRKRNKQPLPEHIIPSSGESMKTDQKLPDHGSQVHNQYTLLAHFLYLKNLFKNAKFIQFSLDREPGIARAFMTAFGDLVAEGDCLAFLVKIEKGMGNDARRNLVGHGAQLLHELAGNQKALEPSEINWIKAK